MSASKSSDTNPSQNSEGANFHQIFVIGEPKKSKAKRNVLLAGGAVGLVGIGTTLAANINLNSGQNIEYGQGIQVTTKCDADGFTIKPHTEYDNGIGASRVADIRITGLNLTAVGTGWDQVPGSPYEDQNAAALAHPGEYYDYNESTWKRTCDGIVMDFRAYTNSSEYANYTLDNYNAQGSPTTAYGSPVMWSQYNGQDATNMNASNAGIAVKFTMNPDSTLAGTQRGINNTQVNGYTSGNWNGFWIWDNNNGSVLNYSDPLNAKFTILFNDDARPRAATISKLSVSTSSEFSSTYLTENYYG